jgi:hypothetical protein
MPACMACCGASYLERLSCSFLTGRKLNMALNIYKKVNRYQECNVFEKISMQRKAKYSI